MLSNNIIFKPINSKGSIMNRYTAVVKQDGNWWIGWIQEVPGVNCQETTQEELIKSLKITLKEALELNKEEAITAAGKNFQEVKIAV